MSFIRYPLAALLLAAPVLAHAQEAPPFRAKVVPAELEFRTDWYGVYLKTFKVGHFQSARAKLADGSVRESHVAHLKIVSFGQKAEINWAQTLVFAAAAPHRLVRGELVQDDGKTKQKTVVTGTDDGLKFVHTIGDARHEETLAGHYTLADTLAQEAWVRSGPQVGDRVSFRNLDVFDRKFDAETSTIKDIKRSLANGVPVRFFEIETVTKNKGVKTLSRHDDKGVMLSHQLAIFELRLEPEAAAKDTGFGQDLFVMGMAEVDRELGRPRAVKELVLEVPAKGSEGLEDGPRQTVTKGATGRLVKLGKAHGKAARATADEIKDALASTAVYPLNDPTVKALAERAVGDATTPREKVKRIVAFVHAYVEPNLSANLPNIYDLMRHKKGDCKSYALLTTVLSRAAGVPARQVSGLLYGGDDLKAFGGHAWNEVVLDGEWVPVDASLNETEVNATHISFGPENRSAQTHLNTLGRLSFRLVDVKHAE